MNPVRMKSRRSMALAAGAMLIVLFVGSVDSTRADSMRVGDFWYNNFAPIEYADGVLVFNIGDVEQNKSLADIDGLKMDNYPTLALAEEAIKAGNHKQALDAFKSARVKAQETWLQIWLDARILPLLDKTGQGMDAGKTFLTMVTNKAPQSLYIENPPIRSVRKATKDQKLYLQTQFKAQMKKEMDASKKKTPLWYALEELAEAADPSQAGNPTNVAVAQEGAIESEIPLPYFLLQGSSDPVTKLLARRQYDRARERLSELVKTAGTGKTSQYLYQLGIADLYQAEEAAKANNTEKASKLYKDAGLKFMRVTIHFPRSKVAGPSLIEAALIHVKLNRKDIAAKLIKQADESVDPDDEVLMKRIEKIREMINA